MTIAQLARQTEKLFSVESARQVQALSSFVAAVAISLTSAWQMALVVLAIQPLNVLVASFRAKLEVAQE